MEIKIGMTIKGRGKIAAVGDGISEGMNAPTWTPVQFADGTYAVLDSVGQPLLFPLGEDGGVDYDAYIKQATCMPVVGTFATGRSTIRVDTTNGRWLTIRVGWGFGREDEPLMHRWETSGQTEEI